MLRNYTHNSLYRSFIKPKQLAREAKEKGWEFVGMCDRNSLSGIVEFYKACKDNEIKPIIGCEFEIDGELFPLFAINRKGLNKLISLCSKYHLKYEVTKEQVLELADNEDIFLGDGPTSNYIEGGYSELELIVNSNKEFTGEQKTKILSESNPIDFSHYDEFYEQLDPVLSKLEDYDLASRPMLPSFSCPNGMSQDEYLRHLCREGWKEKLLAAGKVETKEDEDKYAERVKYELEVLQGAGLSGYFLVVWDIVNYVREIGSLPGPGRGSAAGCLVSYLVGITETDPLEFDLLFGRFYNKSRNTETRVELPDIDLDIPSEDRDKVLKYIKEKYGNDMVCHIGTFGTFQGRSAIEIAFKERTSMSFTEIKEITKMLPEKAKVADKMEDAEIDSLILWTLIHRPEIMDKYCRVVVNEETGEVERYEGDYGELFELAVEIEGIYRSYGKHAAGVVISPSPVADIMPVRIDKDGDIVSTLPMKDVEYMGGVKFDILGVDILSKILTIVKKSKKIDSLDDIRKYDDPEVWDLMCSGYTKGIFQLDSNTGQTWSEKSKPKSLSELSDLTSILRPGCLGATLNGKSMTAHYVDRKHGEDYQFLDDSLKEILKETHGIIVYQEQSMAIARDLAGFSEERADDLRKAIGKKLAKLMKELKEEFINGCVEKGIVDEKTATQIYENIEKSNRYSFNKSHGVVYATDAYWSAYCKCHDMPIFFEVCLNHAHKKPKWKDEIRDLVMDCNHFGIDVNPPRLDRLFKDFTYLEDEGAIYYGLQHIKNVGESAVDEFFENVKEAEELLGKPIHEFEWLEILMTVLCKTNKRVAEALISCGAINGKKINKTRNSMLYEYTTLKSLNKNEIEWMRKDYAVQKCKRSSDVGGGSGIQGELDMRPKESPTLPF